VLLKRNKKMTNDTVEIPVAIERIRLEIYIVSFLLPRVHLREPFFIDSLAKNFKVIRSQIKLPEENELLARPFNYDRKDSRVIFTPVTEFIKRNKKESMDKKLNFIFHMSRCGSTLISQMLACNDRFFVLSEPTIINAVLDPALDLKFSDRNAILSACIVALTFCSPRECESIFIKFRSWNIFYLDLILKEFPFIKWIFIHRHGSEILPSVLEKPPGWLRSRSSYGKYFYRFLNVDMKTLRIMNQDEFIARVLGVFCLKAKQSGSRLGKFIDYSQMPKVFFDVIIKHWDININDFEKLKMINVSNLHSKDISKKKIFISDSNFKRSQVSQEQIGLINKFTEVERLKLINN
jgi:hypothetical protein